MLESCLRSAGLIPSGPAWDIAAKGAPYPGLVPYDGGYSTVFFGRGLAVAEALREIRAAAQRELPALFIVSPRGTVVEQLACKHAFISCKVFRRLALHAIVCRGSDSAREDRDNR